MSAERTAAPFEIGQDVFTVYATAYSQITVPCPICFGKLFVTLILGNGEHQPIECDMCGKGYEGPQGTTISHAPFSKVSAGVVTGLSCGSRGWTIEVNETRYVLDDALVFLTQEEAEARRVVLHEKVRHEAQIMDERNLTYKKKGHAWKAGYHRAEAAENKRRMEWHLNKLAERKTATEAKP